MKSKILKSIAVLLLYICVSLLLCYSIIGSPGNIIGGDWALPSTKIQINENFKSAFYTWGGQGTIFGARQTIFTTFFFQVLIQSLSLLGFADSYTKILLISVFSFAGFSMFLLANYFKLHKIPAFLSGVFYITTPLFFNYSIMGWIFALFAMATFPLAVLYFIRSVKEKKIKYAIATGIIYAVSVIQSQSVIWFMIAFVILAIYLIRDKNSLFWYVKSLVFIIALFFLLNFYWLLNLLLVQDRGISGSDIVKSSVSLGNLGHLKPSNFIRLFGSLYNFQYETAVNKFNTQILSFVIPLLALGSLFLKNNRRLIISLWLIALIPSFIYLLNFDRDFLLYLPFSNVIRDFLRFLVLTTFAYPLLASFSLHYLLTNRLRIFFIISMSLALISIYPWFVDNIGNWNPQRTCDMRMRTKVFPKEYLELEYDFSKKLYIQKAFYVPLMLIDFTDDKRFLGTCNEIVDVFAGYSPIQGSISFTDRGLGYLEDYARIIKNNLDRNLVDVLKLTNVVYFVVRKNTTRFEVKPVLESLSSLAKKGNLDIYFENDKVSVFKSRDFLPQVYVPQQILFDEKTDSLKKITHDLRLDSNPALFFTEQNKDKKKLLQNIRELPLSLNRSQTIEFKKINPIKYRIIAHKVRKNFVLILNELYHPAWKIYLIDGQNKKEYNQSDIQILNNQYIMFERNEDDQATSEETQSYLRSSYLSEIGNNFISKRRNRVVQNDNLNDGKFYETFFIKNITQNNHLVANAYANSWYIETEPLCKLGACKKNADGTYEMEFVIEFWPQRTLFIGSFISMVTLLSCLGYIFFQRKTDPISR